MIDAKRVQTVILVVAGLAAFVWQAHLYSDPMLSDDAFISFRYACNLADGHGLVFNPGERVEGFTNLLWVLILAAARRFGGDVPTAAHLLGLVLGGTTVVLIAAWPRRLAAAVGADEVVAGAWGGVAALLLGLSHPFAYHAAIGLETPLMAVALSAALLSLDPESGRPGWTSSAFFLVAMLTRPEGLALFAVVVAVYLGRRIAGDRRRARLGPVLATTAAYVIFLGWRWWYFGALVPNTYHAKRAALLTDLGGGLDYLGSYIAGGHGAVAAAVAVLLVLRFGWRTILRWPLFLLAAHALMVVSTGGDHFWFWRFFAPLVPLVAALAAVALSAAWQGSGGPLGRTATLAAAALAGAALLLPGLMRADLVRSTYDAHDRKWILIGKRLGETVPRDTWIALSPVGAIPYYSQLPTVDILGLTDRHIARQPADPSVARKAHQKHDGAYVLSRRPDLLVLGNGLVVADGEGVGELRWFPELAVDVGGHITRGPAVDWYRRGRVLTYEADIHFHPDFRRCYRPVLLPLVDDLRLLAWERLDSCPPGQTSAQPTPSRSSAR